MNTRDMSREYLRRSQLYLEDAKTAFNREDYPTVVRRSQESLELATKAALRFLGVEYPREHDVGAALGAVAAKLPDALRESIPSWRQLLRDLARDRGPSFYGDEKRNIPASRLFGREYAERILPRVEQAVKLIADFIVPRS